MVFTEARETARRPAESIHGMQSLRHPRLPSRTGRTPARNDISRKAERNQLTRIRQAWTTGLLDRGGGKHRLGELRQFFVLMWLYDVRVDTREVRTD